MERHEKWVRVEAGTTIPAGQPYRVENEGGYHSEYPGRPFADVYYDRDEIMTGLFVDSSWKPPLVLPTEPTWGIVMVSSHRLPYTGKWIVEKDGSGTWLKDRQSGVGGITTSITGVTDFVPLSDEQIARIEAAR